MPSQPPPSLSRSRSAVPSHARSAVTAALWLWLVVGSVAVARAACTGSGDSCLYNPESCGECAPAHITACTQSGTIHLTIDDGPFDNSGLAMDILKWKQVKATFFVVGSQISGRTALLARMKAEGHNVQSHSNTHPHLNTLTGSALTSELSTPTSLIKTTLGSTYSVGNFRPPYGECHTACMTALTAAGMKGTYWNLDSQDWQLSMPLLISAIDAAPAIVPGAPGIILLIHLENNFGLCALPYIIDRLRFKGYNFVTADQCWGTASQGTAIPVTVPPPTTNPAWPTCTIESPVVTGPVVNPCTTNNGGCMVSPLQAVCTGTTGSAVCSCPSGFTGNGITSCVCSSGYYQNGTGASATCVDVNECATNNGGCHSTAGCTNTPGSRTCWCRSGFTGDAMSGCFNANECAANNGGCDSMTVCTDQTPTEGGGWTNTHYCSVCPDGYWSSSGTGSTACQNVNECATNNGGCSVATTPVVQCTDSTPTAANGNHKFSCGQCPSGWTGDGWTCTDIDECASTTVVKGGCSPMPEVHCVNTPGSRLCAVGTGCSATSQCANCPPGFEGNGVGDAGCTDVNECAANNGGCLSDGVASCVNTIGNRTCTCRAGLTGDGVRACDNINECALGLTVAAGGCDALTNCTDATPTAGNSWATRTCSGCPSGYTGTGATGCDDINECAAGNGGCHALRVCTNTPGNRTCSACPAGYATSGVAGCADVNECATGGGGCFVPDTCANTVGSFTCGACPLGMAGDGKTCTPLRQCSGTEPVNGGCDPLTTCSAVTPTAANGWSAVACSECPAGYSGTGTSGCVNVDECASSPCQNGGECHDGVNEFHCDCSADYAGNLCTEESASAKSARLATIVVPVVVGGVALLGLAVCGVRYARNRRAQSGAAAANGNANANANANGAGAKASAKPAAASPPAAVRSANPSARSRVGSPRRADNSLV